MRYIIYIAVAAAAVLAGCNEKQEQATYSRVPGLSSAPASQPIDQAQANSAPRDASGQVNTALLAPGKPSDPNTTGAATTGPMMGGIPQAPDAKVLVGGNKLQVAGIAFTVPDGWKSVKPSSSFRAAQYELPGKGGPAELAVFYFGPGQGGGIEDNVKRWAGQFKSDDPTTNAVPVEVAEITSGELSLALVRARGTYDPGSMGPMMGAAPEPKPNYALLGLVVVGGPDGAIFLKTTGPAATIDEQSKSFEQFARSAKKSNYK
jgi:hypothetical protein